MAGHARSFDLWVALEALAATAASRVALALGAKIARRGAFQPLNATSHWLNGGKVADETALGWRTTGVGLATHLTATAFWAAIYEGWVRQAAARRRALSGRLRQWRGFPL